MHLQTCDISTAKKLILMQNKDQACLVVGPHGCGKSELMYEVASELRDDLYKDEQICEEIGKLLANEGKMGKLVASNGGKWKYEFGLPVIERRLSQMSEGELTGVPSIENSPHFASATTRFNQMDFMAITYKYPVVLFLDELNRAFLSLRQATFQIADSKIFLGNKLHEGTRVYVAANIGPLYQADDFDVAEFSRYSVFAMAYNSEEWLKWARRPNSGVHSLVVDFISQNNNALYVDDKKFALNSKFPDPRAWTKVGRRLSEMEKEGTLKEFVEDSSMLAFFTSGLIGPDEGMRFSQYCKENAIFFGVEDILQRWDQVSTKIPTKKSLETKRKQIILELATKVISSIEDHHEIWVTQNPVEHKNFFNFLKEVPDELLLQLAQTFMKYRENTTDALKQKASAPESLTSKSFIHFKEVLRNLMQVQVKTST